MVNSVISTEDLCALLRERGAHTRSLTAIAGPPAAGKSTLARWLVSELDRQEPGSAAVVEMDGFHFDDTVLEARGHASRKGAPHTFDVAGFAVLLERLRAGEPDVAVPVFDRTLEVARAGAHIVSAQVRHVVVEGNYLLLDTPPWRALRSRFDTTVFVTASLDTLRSRLVARWTHHRRPVEEAEAWIRDNDLVNAKTVLEGSRPAEFTVRA